MEKVLLKLRTLCVVGLLLSVYATYVEIRAEQDANYVALCEISERISCTAVFNTFYGKGFGLIQHITGASSAWNQPNGVLGIIFYVILFLSSFLQTRLFSLFHLFLCIASNLMSVYLAYLLYFVLEELCVICVAIYVVNYFCLVQSCKIYQRLWQQQPKEQNSDQQSHTKID